MERRAFLKGTGALAAGLSGAGTLIKFEAVEAMGLKSVPRSTPNASVRPTNLKQPVPLQAESADLTPYSGPWTDTQMLHLLRRATFGTTIAQYTEAKALGSMAALVNKLTDTTLPPPTPPGAYVAEYLSNTRGDAQTLILSRQRLELMRSQEIVNWWFDLMVKEDLSIRERMTLLWSNHFVTGTTTVQHAGYTYQYLATLRQYALGNFKAFVNAIAIDPSMLVYLNGNQSYTKNVNENFARELMELFTLGLVDPRSPDPNNLQPNYTETDVQNSAKALTGWVPNTIPNATAPYFTGTFYPARHDSSTNLYLGKQVSTLSDVIDAIFSLGGGYNVAWFISQKIYANFVYYNTGLPQDGSASQGVIDAMAKLLIQSNWELKPVVQALLSSAHFYDPNVIGSQLKSPVHFMANFFREFGMTYAPYSSVDPPSNGVDAKGVTIYTDPNLGLTYLTTIYASGLLGQQLLNPPNVKGWPGGENWISTGTFQDREAITYSLLGNLFDGSAKVRGIKFTFDPVAWAQSYPNAMAMDPTELSNALNAFLLAQPLGTIETNVLYQALLAGAIPKDWYIDVKPVTAYAQVLGNMPEFQLS